MFRALIALVRVVRREPGYRLLTTSVAALIATGTAFYSVNEGWSVLDSLFFSVTTLTTIGYGNLVPDNPASKIFTIVYILLGAAMLVAFFNIIVIGLREMGEQRGRHRAE